MKKSIIALAIFSAFSVNGASALPLIYGAENCGANPMPGIDTPDIRIECLGYKPFDPLNPTHGGIASILRINAPNMKTQNGVANLGQTQSNQADGYVIGAQGIAESSGTANGVRGGKFEAYTTGIKDEVAGVQVLVGGSTSPDATAPNTLSGIQIKARANLPNAQVVNSAIELVVEPANIPNGTPAGSYAAGIKMNGASIEWDDLHRTISIPNIGVCAQSRPNKTAAWR